MECVSANRPAQSLLCIQLANLPQASSPFFFLTRPIYFFSCLVIFFFFKVFCNHLTNSTAVSDSATLHSVATVFASFLKKWICNVDFTVQSLHRNFSSLHSAIHCACCAQYLCISVQGDTNVAFFDNMSSSGFLLLDS